MIMWCGLCYVNLFDVILHPKPEFLNKELEKEIASPLARTCVCAQLLSHV